MSVILTNICKSYGDARVLRGVSLELPQGITCLMGPSGGGKTTLLRILVGLEKPDSGSIRNLPDRIAMVFQEDRLTPSLTVRANLRLALGKGYSDAQASACLSRLGLDDVLGRTVSTLSGGMKRRIALARALLFDAPLMVLDEPFKGLDDALLHQCMDVLLSHSRGRSVLLVTHDAQEAQYLGTQPVLLDTLQTA